MAVKSINTIKSYLTEGKYPTASELVDIIDTFVSIGQNSGGSASDSYLKLVPDLDAYTSEAPIGEIVKYIGKSNGQYTRGWDYEKVSSGSTPTVKILSEFNYRSISGSRPFYAYEYTEQVEGYFGFVYGTDKLPLLTFSKTLTAGDKVAYWNSDKTTVTIATISSVTSDGFFIDSNIYISLVDMMDCPISKYTCAGNSSYTCLVKGTTDELIIPEVALMHERFYFNNGSLIGYGQGSNNAFIYRETININIPANTAYIATINNASYQGPFYPTGKIGNQYFKILYYDDLDNCYACGYEARGWMLIGDDVFFGSQSGNNFIFNGNKTTIKSVSPNIRFNSGTSPSSSATSASSGYIEFVNANGDLIYVHQNLLIDAPNTKTTFDVYVPSTGEAFTPTIETAITSNPVAISIGTPSVYWQPIIYPSAPVSSGD